MESFRLDLRKYNSTSSNMRAEFSETFSSPFLLNPSEWELSIDRFRIPMTTIPVFLVHKNTDHWIRLEVNDVRTSTGATFKTTGTANLPLSADFAYMSPSDFVSAVNKAFSLAWQSLLTTGYSNFISTVNGSDIAFKTVGGSTSSTIAVNISNSVETAFVQLQISDFKRVSQTGSEPDVVSIYLINPAGIKCCVSKGVILEAARTYVFQVGATKDQSLVDFTLDSNSTYQPTDNFERFSTSDPNGNWSLKICPCGNNALDITVDYQLKVYGAPRHSSDVDRRNFPPISPKLTLDTTTGYFSIMLHERFINSSMHVIYGPALRNILAIEKSPRTDGVLQVPMVTLTNALNSIITIRAETARMYQLCAIDRINIFSNGFPVTKDLQIANVPSFALASFSIDPAEVQDSTYSIFSFSGGDRNSRRYRLNSSVPLNNLDLSFQVQFVDGTTQVVEVLPTELFNVLITFQKVE